MISLKGVNGVHMNEKVGFSINGYSIFIVLVFATVYIFSQIVAASIDFVSVTIALITLLAFPGFLWCNPIKLKL
jgi:hypothetical protein